MNYLESLMSTGETIQLVVRPHWITVARTIILNGVLIAVCILVAGLGSGMGSTTGQIVLLLAALAVLVPLALLVRDILRWTSKQYVVTTRRMLEVEGVFNKSVSDSNLDKINDIVLRQSLLGRALGYGDIQVITGSDVGINHIERIREPLRFQRTILDNKEDFDTLARLGQGTADGDSPDGISAAIERLAGLRDRGALSNEEFERKKAELLARL